MYHPNRILERELEFTKIYRENIGQPKAVRESRCMDAQMATYFVTIQPQDLIAGRISRPYVVLHSVWRATASTRPVIVSMWQTVKKS